MGDDLWFLVCSSENEVERIISLRRWDPPGFRVKADKWMTGSGTSDVEGGRGWKWVTVKGIPLHLRSEAVFRDIASCFGNGAVCSELGCKLNEVRVRVHISSEIPKGLWLQFREGRFWVSVFTEAEVDDEGLGVWMRKGRDQIVGMSGSLGLGKKSEEDVCLLKLGAAGGEANGDGSSVGMKDDGRGDGMGGRFGVVSEEEKGMSEIAGDEMGTGHKEMSDPPMLAYGQQERGEGELAWGEVGLEGRNKEVVGLDLKECETLLSSLWGGPELGLKLKGFKLKGDVGSVGLGRRKCKEG
ncbi:hypothetical protein LINPERPRIM_LOCUS7762 [Linum perenne]